MSPCGNELVRPMSKRLQLTKGEFDRAFSREEVVKEFPPILDVKGVAKLLSLKSHKTVYHWISQGWLDGAYRKRGKHLLFWRDRVIQRIFDGPEWRSE